MTDSARSPGSLRGSAATLALLTILAAGSWAWLVWHPAGPTMDMTATMGLSLLAFMLLWIVMMVAMMFPTAAPMILTFQKLRSRQTAGGAFLATWLFVAAYLLLWILSGVATYALARGTEIMAETFAISPIAAARVGGALIVLAGLYQLTPLKDACLSTCQTPVTFIMASWRPGLLGALRMGWRHGLYCFGCCWLLFVILFPLGMMNIAAMAAITLLIFAEKTLPWGRWGSRVAGILLIAYGALVMGHPHALPHDAMQSPMTMGADKTMDMPMSMPMTPKP